MEVKTSSFSSRAQGFMVSKSQSSPTPSVESVLILSPDPILAVEDLGRR